MEKTVTAVLVEITSINISGQYHAIPLIQLLWRSGIGMFCLYHFSLTHQRSAGRDLVRLKDMVKKRKFLSEGEATERFQARTH